MVTYVSLYRVYCIGKHYSFIIFDTSINIRFTFYITAIYFFRQSICQLDPYPAKVIYLNYQQLEVVSRYRDPQPQVVEN